LRSFEQVVDPVQSDSLSPAEPSPAIRSGGPSAAVNAPHYTLRQVQHDRLSLQRRAPSTLRRHLARAVARFAVLLTADLTAFAILRELYRSVGEGALLGDWIANTVHRLLPAGYLDGWQYALALVVGLIVTGNYGAGDRRRDAALLFWGCALATALPLWAPLWDRGLGVVAVQYSVTAVVVWLGVVAVRFGVDAVDARIVKRTPASTRTILIGTARECADLANRPVFAPRGDHIVFGFVDTAATPNASALGGLGDLPTFIQEQGVETVVICGHLSDAQLHDVVEQSIAAGCHVFSVPRTFEVAGVQPSVVWKRGQPLVELTAQTLKAQQLVIKRAADLVGATLGLVMLAPLLLLVAVIVKLDSRGPIFFRQERIGSGGRRFNVLKFRTMRDGVSDHVHRRLFTKMMRGDDGVAELAEDGRPVFKLTRDDRVTRVGRWLRRMSLDELPQLVNVLRGEMSLVGPRPPLPYEFEAYDHWQFDRLQVKPGLTGLWQVSGRNLLTYRQMCELDVTYVRGWSLWLDIRILLKTVPVVLFNSGRAA
jgi:exopolysaccharide biosynthesis polyprenyl glycosylphosphotransferase